MSAVEVVDSGAPPSPLEEAAQVFRAWLHLPDLGALHVLLGAVAANRADGDPVWLLLVGPPGGGKSEMLQAIGSLDDVHAAATLTEAALLSGTPKKEHDSTAKGGLLRQIGRYGILLCKDFGSILSMHRDGRAAVLAALREVYDGSWTRHLGISGGITLHWQGKVGLIAGCTPTIDGHHAVMGSMGERFALYRLPPIDGAQQARAALAHAGREEAMRSELRRAVTDLFARPPLTPAALTETETERLVQLAVLAVRCRSAVERDGYSREVELIPEPEAPGRLALVLSRLLMGMRSVGVPDHDCWLAIVKVALDSMPAIRRTVLEYLLAGEQPTPLSAVASAAGYPRNTTARALEDLAAHGVVVRSVQGAGKADLWSVSQWTRQRWEATQA